MHPNAAPPPERAEYYARLDRHGLAPLWERLRGLIQKEPRSAAVPALWRYAEVRPFIVLTSNAKRELSDPFLRRCYCHPIAFPDPGQMREIVKLHFPDIEKGLLDAALVIFYDLRQRGYEKPPATSELLNWLGALQHARVTPERLNIPFVGTLLKRTEDILSYRAGGKRPVH